MTTEFEQLKEAIDAVEDGEVTINEARRQLGLEPVLHGDIYLIIRDGEVVGIRHPE